MLHTLYMQHGNILKQSGLARFGGHTIWHTAGQNLTWQAEVVPSSMRRA